MKPNETVQLFFNGNEKVINDKESKDNVYKEYILVQNTNLLEENKKLLVEKNDVEKKYEELEDETETAEKRLSNTKHYLKNFRFINENLDNVLSEYQKFSKDMHIKNLVNEFRLLLGCFSFVMLLTSFLFANWTLFILFVCMHSGFLYLIHELMYLPHLWELETRRKNILKFQKEKEKEIKQMKKTMDIVSEFIDNAL